MRTTQPVTQGQAEPALPRSSAVLLPTTPKVVVIDAGIEIHGYVVARKGNRVSVVWAVASGRHRHRLFPAERVFLPVNKGRWVGYLIPHEQLIAIRQAHR